VTDERARELAAEILSRPEYDAYRRPPTALDDLVEVVAAWLRGLADLAPTWLVDLWDGFWEGVRSGVGLAFGDDALVVLLRLALALAVLAALGMGVARVVREVRERRAEAAADVPAAVDTGDWMADAEDLARGGRFVEAAHCAQLASLQILLRKRWLELERSDPNRTLRRRLGETRLPVALRERFLGLLDRLEASWFRDRVGDSDLYADWRALHADLTALPESR